MHEARRQGDKTYWSMQFCRLTREEAMAWQGRGRAGRAGHESDDENEEGRQGPAGFGEVNLALPHWNVSSLKAEPCLSTHHYTPMARTVPRTQ